MCEQTEVRYLDGDVVWVKLGSCWWPGRVEDVDKLPEEILVGLKKRPIAAVKFFQENTFEYVRNLNQICMYNCRRKNEYIKKGLDIFRSRRREGSSVMDKFPEDVSIAERLTGGDPDILRDSAFAPEERPNYRNIFGGDKKSGSPDKKNKHNGSPSKDQIKWKVRTPSSANGRRSQPISPSLPVLQQPRQITHPRFVSEVKDDSDHVVRIRQQPVSTPSRDEQASTPSPQYKCHLCDFTSKRLNVIVLHNKFHSADAANNGQGVGAKSGSASKSKSAENKSSGKGRASTSSPSDRTKVRSKTVPVSCETPKADFSVDRSAPKRKLIDEVNMETTNEESGTTSKQAMPKSPEKPPKTSERKSKTSIFGKRKGSKWGGERPIKKKKNDEEIREKLLADWNDEDEEQEEKEIELMKQELSKSELTNTQSNEVTTVPNQTENIADMKASGSEETLKPKITSCFDFDDTEDANLGSELEERAKKFVENRKIPRIIDDKSDIASKRRCIVEDTKPVDTVETLNVKEEEPLTEVSTVQVVDIQKTETTEPTVGSEDIDAAFKTLLAETTVPALPEVPQLPNTVTSPVHEVGGSTTLPDVVLDSNNSHSALDSNNSVSTLPEVTSVENSGGDHDYSIKKETEEGTQEKPEASEPKSPKIDPPIAAENSQMPLEDDEMELDINSMPVVMTDAIITEEHQTNKVRSDPMPLIDLIPSSADSHSTVSSETNITLPPLPVTNTATVVASSEPSVMPKSSIVDSPQLPCSSGSTIVKTTQGTPIKTVKLQASAGSSLGVPVAVSGTAISTIGKLKNAGADTVIPQKGPGGGKLVIVQTSPGQQSRYTVGKASQQRITQQQIVQQAVGGSKVLILTKPQGSGQQKILATAISQQQRILTTGGKLQTQPQRIMTNTGAILTAIHPRSVMAKGTKLTPISQQQMRALQGGKQTLGTKFTMQSTQAKVILPSMQKASVTPTSPVRVIGTLKPQSNTILIQTTQGTTVSGTVLGKPSAASSGQLQAKIGTTQSITRLSTPKPKILTSHGITSSVQRISVPATMGGKTLQSSQIQSKLLGIRPTVTSRMVVQKVQGPLPTKTGNVGVPTNVSQVKKMSGIFPRVPSIQKISQPTGQTQVAQKVSSLQSFQKVITPTTMKKTLPQPKGSDVCIASKRIPVLVSPTTLQSKTDISSSQTLPSLQPLQPNVSVGPTIQQNNIVLSTSHSTATTANIPVAQCSNINLPSLQPTSVATTAGTSVLTPEQIAQVVAATPTEQLGDSGTATYVLVTIDDSGALQPYDSSTLLTYDGSAQTNEGAARTLYIDPSSISTSGDLENIILTIDNSASSSGAVLNLGQTNTMPVNPVTSMAMENSSTSSVFNIGPATHVSGTSAPQSGGSNQDILAEALANTQVFQPDSAIQDSLTVVNSNQSTVMTPRLLEPSSLLTSSPSTLHQATMLLPSLSTVLPPPNPAGVLETSLTLNQPIMTPLEVPSSAVPSLQTPPPPVPSSLELPLTITQPTLSVTSQPYTNLPVTASSHITCSISENSMVGSPISDSTLPLTMTESRSISAVNFSPSMPLLSEETDSHNDMADSAAVVPANSSATDQSQSLSDASYSQDSATTSHTVMQESVNNHVEDLITPQDTRDNTSCTILTSYTEDSENVSQGNESHIKSAEIQDSLFVQPNPYEQDPERMDPSNRTQSASEIQPSADQTLTSSQDQRSGNVASNHTEILDSSSLPPHPESISGSPSESSVMDHRNLDANHSSSHHALDQSTSYSHVPENTTQLVASLAVPQGETPTTLPAFSEIPENNVELKLGLGNPEAEKTTFQTNSKIPENSSSFQVNSQTTTIASCYLQTPESNSGVEEKLETNKSSEQILDSTQNSCNTQSLTSFHEAPESTFETTEIDSELQLGSVEKVTFTSFSSENTCHSATQSATTDADVSQQSLFKASHSMPLLIDEPMTETVNDSTRPDQPLGAKSPLKKDDILITNMDKDKSMSLDQSERSKDQGSLSPKSVPCPDLHDDETADSDEDLPPAFSPHQDCKKKTFRKDDVVWVPNDSVYWPAVVTNVNRKNRKVYVKIVNSPRKSKAYSIDLKSLISFEDSKKNKQLLELGKRSCADFQSVYDKVKQFYVKKCHQHKLSAARFLTFDPSDVLYGTLSDGSGSTHSNVLENEEDNYELLTEEIESCSENTSDDNVSTKHSCSEIVGDDEIPSSSAKLSQEELMQKEEEAKKLLEVIQSDACWNHLCRVYREEVYSKRHAYFMSGNYKMKSNLKYYSGSCIFPKGHLELELANTLQGYIQRLGILVEWSDYMFYVWMPEALIFALQKVHNINEEEAKHLFFKFGEETF